MKCNKCRRKSQTAVPHLGPLCKSCFCTTIEKRIRRHVRVNRIFSKGDKIIAVGALNCYLIPRIIEGLPVDIKLVKQIPAKVTAKDKVIVGWTLDDMACAFLEQLFSARKLRERYLSILKVATDKELVLFAKFKGIEFKPNPKNIEIKNMLDSLETEHPETKFSLAKSIEQLKISQKSQNAFRIHN